MKGSTRHGEAHGARPARFRIDRNPNDRTWGTFRWATGPTIAQFHVGPDGMVSAWPFVPGIGAIEVRARGPGAFGVVARAVRRIARALV